MTRAMQWAVAATVLAAVLLIFVHPLLVGMPAPNAKVRSVIALVAFTLAIAVAMRMAAVALEPLPRCVASVQPRSADRLAMICTLLC